MSNRTALIVGASGLVGQALLQALLESDDYSRVIAAGRRPLVCSHPKLDAAVVEFRRIRDYARDLNAHDVYCTIGTTLKQAGSRAAFRRVDFDYCLGVARLARDMNARNFVGISSVGANPEARFFYTRVKGELEEAVAALGLRRYFFVRPSLLRGLRTRPRLSEQLSMAAARLARPLLLGRLARYRPIDVTDVARAMMALALGPTQLSGPVESDALMRIAATI